MINLFTTYFVSKNSERQKEIDFCIKQNSTSKLFDKIFVLVNEKDSNARVLRHPRIYLLVLETMPMYSDFFAQINTFTSNDDWNVIANVDIFFDHSIQLLNEVGNAKDVCFALSRYDVVEFGPPSKVKLWDHRDSQDTWIFKGHVRFDQNANVYLGKAGCDNKIAHVLLASGYNVINPCYHLKTYHYHLTGHRTYNANDRYHPPYYLPEPVRSCAYFK